jgi:hypothetical protein
MIPNQVAGQHAGANNLRHHFRDVRADPQQKSSEPLEKFIKAGYKRCLHVVY